MSFLSTNQLKDLLPNCIDPFKVERVKNAQYELSLGNQVYLTNSESGTKDILDEKKSQIVIDPGQFGILLTEEIVTIPLNKIGFISIKFKQKKKGLVNVSGFHVDPGFSGRIKFSVYNAGPAKIVLDKGQACFLIWFSELTSDAEEYKGEHQKQMEILADDIEPLRGELASPNVLLEKIKERDTVLRNVLWAAGILITLGISLTVISLSNLSRFNDSYVVGKKERLAKEEIDSAANKFKFDSLFEKRIQMIIDSMFKKDSSSIEEKKPAANDSKPPKTTTNK